MEEEKSASTSNDKAEELLMQLETHPEQPATEPDNIEQVGGSSPAQGPAPMPPLPGWLRDLKKSMDAQEQVGDIIATALQRTAPPADPKKPGSWVSSADLRARTLQSGPPRPEASTKSGPDIELKTTNEREALAKPFLDTLKTPIPTSSAAKPPVPTSSETRPSAASKPSQDGQSSPRILRIPPTLASKSSGLVGSGKSRRLASILACLVLVIGVGIIWLARLPQTAPKPQPAVNVVTPPGTSALTPQGTTLPSTPVATRPAKKTPTAQQPTPAPAPTKVPTKAPTSPPVITSQISFEDGQIDGWQHTDPDSTVRAIQNTTSKAKDGSHALMISFNSDNDQMYPTIGSNNVPRTLNGGETLTGYILKTQGSSVEVIFYVADQSGTWFKDDNSTTYVNSVQTWYPITFKVPANFQGPATHVGVVLFGYDAVVYIDAISWR